MQIGELGHHDSSSHQVTNCIHAHGETPKEGRTGMAAAQQTQQVQQAQQELQRQDVQLTPIQWMQNLLEKTRALALSVWRGEAVSAGQKGVPGTEETGAERQSALQQGAASGKVVEQKAADPQKTIEQMSPYFVMPEKKETSPGMFQRFRLKVHTVTGYLEKHLPFAQTGSFQAKKEQTKGDLRKRSRYRKDELEIECILTDDSYLMDSYDRRGEYSKLSTENKK